jgi:indole-3-glycerol phosphate synthase
MNIRDVVYETARQFSEIAASQRWIEQKMLEIQKALNSQQRRFDRVLKELGIVVETKRKKPEKIKYGSGRKARETAMKIQHFTAKKGKR